MVYKKQLIEDSKSKQQAYWGGDSELEEHPVWWCFLILFFASVPSGFDSGVDQETELWTRTTKNEKPFFLVWGLEK